jgi:hypothetical protein
MDVRERNGPRLALDKQADSHAVARGGADEMNALDPMTRAAQVLRSVAWETTSSLGVEARQQVAVTQQGRLSDAIDLIRTDVVASHVDAPTLTGRLEGAIRLLGEKPGSITSHLDAKDIAGRVWDQLLPRHLQGAVGTF